MVSEEEYFGQSKRAQRGDYKHIVVSLFELPSHRWAALEVNSPQAEFVTTFQLKKSDRGSS